MSHATVEDQIRTTIEMDRWYVEGDVSFTFDGVSAEDVSVEHASDAVPLASLELPSRGTE